MNTIAIIQNLAMRFSEPSVERDYLMDNLKFLLISLVVIGHWFGPYMEQSLFFKILVTGIYTFHMPMFVFVSGYFSKSLNSSNPHKLVATILVPYLFFVLLWDVKEYVHAKSLSFDIFNPPFHLWYLLSLFFWKLLTPLFRTVKGYFPISIMISLLIGLSTTIGQSAVLERTFSLFPFFILGTRCSATDLYALHKKKYFLLIGVILLGLIFFAVVRYNALDFKWLLWDRSYKQNSFNVFTGPLFRLSLMLVAGLIGLSLLVLTSAKKLFFTSTGARTLPVYIFPGFILPTFLIHFSSWSQIIIDNIVIVVFPFLLILLLSLPFVDLCYKRIISLLNSVLLINSKTNSTNREPI